MDLYLRKIKELRIDTNFWCSQEYLSFAGAVEKKNDHFVWLEDPDAGLLFFPSIDLRYGFLSPYNPEHLTIWSDFAGFSPVFPAFHRFPYRPEFLDYEYLYWPNNFQNMRGGRWKVFRKNVRKWPRRNRCWRYELATKHSRREEADILELVAAWLEAIGIDKVHDGDVMIKFAVGGEYRALLYRKDQLVGMNVWDYSPTDRINFRYSIALPGEDFLSDYLRFLFYTSPPVRCWGLTVNDGGALDNPGLKKYKEKLNPIRIRTVQTWRRETDES